jgi:hypothetical protein
MTTWGTKSVLRWLPPSSLGSPTWNPKAPALPPVPGLFPTAIESWEALSAVVRDSHGAVMTANGAH